MAKRSARGSAQLDRLVGAYRWMLTARRIDDSMWTLRRQGKGHFVVSSAGHEAIGAAAGLAVDPEQDWLAPHYRDLAPAWPGASSRAKSWPTTSAALATRVPAGRQPYAHWGSTARHIVSQEGPQPNVVTHAVGVALANRRLGSPGVVWISFGDGGAQKGEVHEAMNFASIHRLPVVFCVQNNLYTQSVPLRLESSVVDLSLRAAGYGHAGRFGRRDGRAGGLPGGSDGRRASTSGRGADAHRGARVSVHAEYVQRRRHALSVTRRSRAVARARPHPSVARPPAGVWRADRQSCHGAGVRHRRAS